MGRNQIHINQLLDKLITEDLNDLEKKELVKYIRSSYKDEQLDILMQKHWDSIEDYSKSNLDELKNLKNRVLKLTVEEDRKIIPLKEDWKSTFMKLAAVLVIPLLLTSAYLFFSLINKQAKIEGQLVMQEVIASPGSRVHFTLPDNTEVWLNSASKLQYSVNFNQQKRRKVKLSGQGYFKVAHDKSRPFFVQSGGVRVQVLGTSFDVSSYADDAKLISTLEEGSIAIMDSKWKEVARLEPGQQAQLNKKTRELHIEKVDTKLSTSWKDGKLIFRYTPLNQVIKQLERWYNCEIEVAPEVEKSEFKFSATIQDETMGEVLKMLEISSSFKTEITNRNVKIWIN